MLRMTTGLLAVVVLAGGAAWVASSETITGQASSGDWQPDRPGTQRLLTPADLPAPSQDEAARNPPKKVPMPDGTMPQLPEGFTAELLVKDINNPRVIRVAPNGDVFVADSASGRVLVLLLNEATVNSPEVFASGLVQPYGIAFYPPGPDPQWIYIANSNGVVRFKYANGDVNAAGAPEEIVTGIPSSGHWTRDIAFSADGKTMYLSVGSDSNVALEMPEIPPGEGGLEVWNQTHPVGATWGIEERRANVLAFDADGKNERIFATGLRNCSGMAMQPDTQSLWCVVNERDALGDDLPFDYATSVREGGFYGWPWYYIGDNEDPRHAGKRPDLKTQVTVPDVLLQAHSAPLNIAFYDGGQFPEDYRGDAFVALHGSWNRSKRTGYKVVRLIFEEGKPTGAYEDFMTGFVVSSDEVWGRPVGVAVAKDGSLLVTEDGSGTIWRVTYKTKSST